MGPEWLELLLRHVPDRYEHLVRYVGCGTPTARAENGRKPGMTGTRPTLARRAPKR